MSAANRPTSRCLSGEIIEIGPIPISPGRMKSNEIHRIFSIKAGMRIVTVESSLEADAIYWAEANTDIISLCEQPLRVHKRVGSKPYYTFDLSLKFLSGKEVMYEVKPEQSMQTTESGKLIPKNWELIEGWALHNGYIVDVLTEHTLSRGPEETLNWRRLLPIIRNSYQYPDQIFENQLLTLFSTVDKVKLLYVFKQFSQHSQHSTLASIGKLIHQGKLQSDLHEARLSPDTVVFMDIEGEKIE